MEENNNLETPPVSVVTNPPPINPIKPASKFSIKAIIGTIIFLILAGGAAAGYVYREPIMSMVAKPTPTPVVIQTTPTPTPDPTADWKTYTNTKFGYSLKYPKEYIARGYDGVQCDLDLDCIKPDSNQIGIQKIGDFPEVGFRGLAIDVQKTTGNFSVIEWGQKNSYDVSNFRYTKYILDGYEGILTYIPSAGGTDHDILLSINSNFYHIGINSAGDKEKLKTINQILSTFKFTDLGSEIAGWKTYKGDGFSFKYPGNYPFTKNVDGPAPGTTDILNHNITWKIQRADQNSKCRGDGCRYSKGSSQIKLGQNSANKVVGLIGEIGGNIAENYIDYEITVPNSENLVIFRIKELPSDKTYQELLSLYPPGRKLKEIPTTETETLEQMLSTFKFTE